MKKKLKNYIAKDLFSPKYKKRVVKAKKGKGERIYWKGAKGLRDWKEKVTINDFWEAKEYDNCNLEGELIPLGRILDSFEKIASNKKVIVYCRSGARSATAITQLERKYGFDNLYNLKGGVLAWADRIDTSMAKY